MKKKFGLFVFLWILASSIALWAQTQSRRTYIYDETRQLIGVIDEEGNRLSYTYDAAGNLISIDRLSARGDVDIFFLEPNRGRAAAPPQPGTPVTIHGVGFSTVPTENQVTFNGVTAVVESATTTMIRTSVPAGATTGPVRVTVGQVTATSRSDFIVTNLVVTVNPATVNVAVRQGQQFTAILTEGGRTIPSNVVWSVNSIVGGNPTVGTISPNGRYTAPARIPTPPTVTVMATGVEEPTSRGIATVTIVQAVCVPPPANLVSWWPGDGDARDIIGTNHGTLRGGVTFAPGMVGQAFDFNGVDAGVQVPHSEILNFGLGEFTIEAWIKLPPGPSTNRAILRKFNNSFPYQGYGLDVAEDGTARFLATDCGTGACGWGDSRQPVISYSTVADGNFHHVAGLRKTDGSMQIYIDGVLKNTRVEPLRNVNNGIALGIGYEPFPAYFTRGLIDEVSLYNRALRAEEIQAIFNADDAGKCRPRR